MILELPSGELEDAAAMHAAGAMLARQVRAGDRLLLSGDLGAGKTTLVRGLCVALGVDPDEVASPTFALAHRYEGRDFAIVHADLYRIDDPAELEAAGMLETLDDPTVLGIVEWPEVAAHLLAGTPRTAWLRIEMEAGGRRVVPA